MVAGGVVKNPDGLGRLATLHAAFDSGVAAPFAPMLHQLFYGAPLQMTGMAS